MRAADKADGINGIRVNKNGKPVGVLSPKTLERLPADKKQKARNRRKLVEQLEQHPLTRAGLSSRFCKLAGIQEYVLPGRDGLFVYTLLDNTGVILYVGQTDNIYRRLGQHIDDGRPFARLRVFTCRNVEHMNMLERELIRIFQPPQNKVMYSGPSSSGIRRRL